MRFEDLSEMQLDALREVGNIGAGHSATALSQLVDKPIGLVYPELETVPIGEVPGVFGGPEQLVGATYLRLLGDVSGGILFMTSRDSALALVDLMHSRAAGTTKSFGRDEEALVTHVASILAASYTAAIARMTDLNILPSTPAFALDMAGAILEVAITEVGMTASSALLVRTRFTDEETSVDAGLFFLPDPDCLGTILGRLGMA